MRLNTSETTLVIAGAWNPAIITPEWVIRHCMEFEPGTGEVRVTAAVPAGAGILLDVPRFTIGDISFTARPEALVLMPVRSDEHCMQAVEAVARRAVEILRHTPVGGLGHNFEFTDEDPNPAGLQAFTNAQQDLTDAVPTEWSVAGSTLATSFEADGQTINIQRGFRGGKLTVRFNFHYSVTNADTCAAAIRRDQGQRSMFGNLQLARDLTRRVYGDVENEDQPEAIP